MIIYYNHLLLEIASVLLIHEHQIEEIFDAEFLVDVLHGRRQVVTAEKHPDGDALAADGCAVHNLVLDDCFVLDERMRP